MKKALQLAVFAWAVGSIVLGIAMTCWAETAVTLEWQHPTADPVELADIAGYRLRWRVDGSQTYTTVEAGKVLTFTISGLPDNVKLWFSGQTLDIYGQESPWSAEVYSPAPPKTMGGLKVRMLTLVR